MEVDQNTETLNFGYAETTEQASSIIKVVGVGGGGSNAVKNMFEQGIQDVTYLIINTDKDALKDSPIGNRLLISPDGLGAGADPSLAEQYAEQYADTIRTALNDGTRMIFLTAGMGGGTGTGATPTVARIAHELGILTIGIVTIPFAFEGRNKIVMALEWVDRVRQYVDALLVVNNNRLIDIYPDLTFFNAFRKADDTLTNAARSISEIITKTGYINLDFKDVNKTLKDGGVALISTGQAAGENRVSEAIQAAITSPLLQDNKIENAKKLLFELCFSTEHAITMSEINEMNGFMNEINPDIDVIWGAMVDDSLGEEVRIILLAAGFDMKDGKVVASAPNSPRPTDEEILQKAKEEKRRKEEEEKRRKEEEEIRRKKEEEEKAKAEAEARAAYEKKLAEARQAAAAAQAAFLALQNQGPVPVDNPDSATEPVAPGETLEETLATDIPVTECPETEVFTTENPTSDVTNTGVPVSDTPDTGEPVKITATTDVNKGFEQVAAFYGAEMANKMRIDRIRQNYYMLDNDDLSNEELVSMLEQMPCYNRTAEQLGELKKASQNRKNQGPAPQIPNSGSIF